MRCAAATPRGRFSGESRRSGSSFDHRRSSWDSYDEERLVRSRALRAAPRPVPVAPFAHTHTPLGAPKEVGSALLFSNRPWRQSFHYKPSATFTENQPRPTDNGACPVVCVCVA